MLLLTAGLLPAVRAILDGEAFSQLSLRKQLMKGRHSFFRLTQNKMWLACFCRSELAREKRQR
ncbi:hypothetical protein TX25_04715 [Pseudomonas lactis]|uniref:Uncharacterized protein n=1 Tax=Pseudomonas azotoformans TaxID=47878 RepID=A0A4Q0HU82_PSEAZ|nr:hypothetical protein TX25_04715 [Pseudomonas lactis]RXE52810.1 hypothetical protein B4O85_15805 [Pseudomonas azotoformans]